MKTYLHNRPTKHVLLAYLSCLIFSIAGAQNYSTKGTDFWVGYGAHASMYHADGSINNTDGGSQQMILCFSALTNANITVEIPATGWTKTYSLPANGFIESDPIPKTGADDVRLDSEGVSDNGIHITSDQPVSAYCHIYDNGSSSSTLLFPTNILGQNYTSLNFTQNSDKQNSFSYCFIIASEDSTLIQVIPSVNTQNHKAWVPFTQILQKGQVLNLCGKSTGRTGNLYSGGDLTGTRITTLTNGGICKKIAVFSGSSSISINCTPNTSSTSDDIIQQDLPNAANGKEYALVPSKNMPHNIYRILVYDSSAVVKENGVVLNNLINGRYYQIQASKPTIIESDKSIRVAQYILSAHTCGNNTFDSLGDPEMIYLTPVNETYGSAAFISFTHSGIDSSYVNIVKKSDDPFSVTLDGTPIGNLFQRFSWDSIYAYAQIQVTPGIHQLHADSGFNAIAYGYGNFESYGYNVGFSRNVSNFLSIQNPYANPTSPETCNETPFKIALNLSFQPIRLQWGFYNNPAISPNGNIIDDAPMYDSTFLLEKTIYYRYSLPGYYSTVTTNNVPIKIIVTKATEDGCTDTSEYDYTINVFQKPAPGWSLNDNDCVNSLLHFKDSTNWFGRQPIQWNWDFGNSDTSHSENPAETYTAAGNYNIRLRTINDIGCYSDISKPIFISSKPVASFNISGINCIGNNTFFTDESTINTGNVVRWEWNFGDGTISDTQNIVKQYQVPDTFTVKLLVYSAQNCISDTAIKIWHMYPYPKVNTPPDLFTVKNNAIRITPKYEGNILQYRWSPSLYLNSDTAADPVSIPQASIYYKETVTGEGGCSANADVYIDVIQFLKIPNAFSPNGDGINDTWVIDNISIYSDASVEVFSRYGQPVYISKGYYKPWDGRYDGKPLPVGTYYYIVNSGDKHLPVLSGYVTILK